MQNGVLLFIKRQNENICAFVCYMYKGMLGEVRKNLSKFSIGKDVGTRQAGQQELKAVFAYCIFPCIF